MSTCFVANDGEAVYNQRKEDLELTVAQISSFSSQKSGLNQTVGRSTRAARCDLNHIPCDYAVRVTNRFTGCDLVNSMPEEPQIGVCHIVQEAVNKTIPKKKKSKKAKCLSEEALQTAVERKEAKSKGKRKCTSN